MASNISTGDINSAFPVAGVDNDSQGFRTNFTNIRSNFITAASEITALQTNVSTLQTTISSAVTANAAPATSGSIGSQGQIAIDTNYLYICIATNTWKRISLSSF